MSPEMRAALAVDEKKRHRFRDGFKSLRFRNKFLAEEQKRLRLQQKPSKGLIHKSLDNALEITVILNLMLEMRGKDTARTVTLRCRDRLCHKHRDSLLSQKRVFVHAYPEGGVRLAKALEIRKGLLLVLEIEEFLEHCKETLYS